ncbi:MAG: ABC transporter substrate-binding protein [Clostridiales bacterium]|nr:ABC transporter substrate-binding protein [Clostridiales bacterium]
MKKLVNTVLASVIAIGMLAGCSTPEPEDLKVRVGSLSGPTTIGIVNLMNDVDTAENDTNYEFTVATQPDEIAAALNAGDLDIALIPANLASVLYNRTEGGIEVIDINTYGVLYCLSTDSSIQSIGSLAGKTVITTGQGATPEYAINYLLGQYGITDCTLDFKTEGAEVIASLQENPDQIAILPQPAATAAMAQVEGLGIAFSLDDEWSGVTSDSRLVTGVTVVRTAFAEEHPEAVASFIEDHRESVDEANNNVEQTAQLVVDAGIVGAAPIAQRAIPLCNIVCVTGDQMRSDLQGYLQTLYDANPQAVGGALPGDDFYYQAS